MIINGLQKLTLLDYPEKTACTVFTSGCNFRCPFCHNASLVVRAGEQEVMHEEDFFVFLEKRRGRLDGVCVTGGEPTLQKDLARFLGRIRDMAFLVKLDTNGFRPDVLREVIGNGLVNYVAMDIKSSKESYGKLVGIQDIDVSPVCESVEILSEEKVPFEFRTTAVKGFHSIDDFRKIAEWIKPAERYFIQSYKDSGDVLDSTGVSAFSDEELKEILKAVKDILPTARLRGVD